MPKRPVTSKTTRAVPGTSKPASRRYVGPADGVQACLLRSVGPEILLRVYHDGAKRRFTDYDIWHDDLWVTIKPGAMAGFYRIGKHDIIDHAPQVLGLDATGRRRVRSKTTKTTKIAKVSTTSKAGVPPRKRT
jgi:hypothetical protein